MEKVIDIVSGASLFLRLRSIFPSFLLSPLIYAQTVVIDFQPSQSQMTGLQRHSPILPILCIFPTTGAPRGQQGNVDSIYIEGIQH